MRQPCRVVIIVLSLGSYDWLWLRVLKQRPDRNSRHLRRQCKGAIVVLGTPPITTKAEQGGGPDAHRNEGQQGGQATQKQGNNKGEGSSWDYITTAEDNEAEQEGATSLLSPKEPAAKSAVIMYPPPALLTMNEERGLILSIAK